MKLKDLIEKYGEQEVLCWAERADESLEWVNIKLGKPNPKTVWDFEEGDLHVWIGCSHVHEVPSVWLNNRLDQEAREIGNVFLTREDAEKDVERRKVETLLLKYGGHRWARKDVNYRLGLQYNMVVICKDMYPLQGAIYFDIEQEAQKAIDEIGEERIKKALFEVR